MFDAEHEQVEEIIELFLDKPELDSQTDDMVQELERVGFFPFEIVCNFVKDEAVVPVVAFLEVGGVGFDFIGDFD